MTERTPEETWQEFNEALRSTNDFDAFYWVYRLTVAAAQFICQRLVPQRFQKLQLKWRPLVPCFGVSLVCLVLLSYFMSLRQLILPRWCQCSSTVQHDNLGGCDEQQHCRWSIVHDSLVVYFGMMIIFNYLSTSLTPPGCVPATNSQGRHSRSSCNTATATSTSNKGPSQKSRSSWYGRKTTKTNQESFATYSQTWNRHLKDGKCAASYRWMKETHCSKCDIMRPPRCHHCKVCDRCILQFDHHCVWMSNCIGYNNYRSFLGTLLFLMLGCWYGVFIFFFPFYDLLLQHFHANEQTYPVYMLVVNFFYAGPIWTFLKTSLFIGLENDLVLKIIFPLLFFIASVQTVFLATHASYIVRGVTTLEHKILHESDWSEDGASVFALLQQKDRMHTALHQVLGPKPVLIFFPVIVETCPPLPPPSLSTKKYL